MQKFTTTAGPIQTNRVSKVINHFLWESKGHIELTDYNPEGHKLTGFGDEPLPASLDAYEAIRAKYDGVITAKNHKAIIADFEAATAAIVLPIVDNRTTPEEREARRVLAEAYRRETAEKSSRLAEETAEHVAALRESCPWAVSQDGFKTGAARAAANIKRELTEAFPGVKFSVKSSTFSMGDSVDISWSMGPSEKTVQAITGKYQDSHFDGMQDMSISDNSAYGRAVEEVLGRAKYVKADRADGWDLKHKLAPFVCEHYNMPCDKGIESAIYQNGHHDDLRRVLADIVNGKGWDDNDKGVSFPAGVTLDDVTGITRELVGSDYVWKVEYNQPTEPTPASPSAPSPTGYTVEKHYHEKRGSDFWLAVPVERMAEDDYRNELSRAKASGGWQSRKWGRTPSGFGFASEDAANRFAGVAPASPERMYKLQYIADGRKVGGENWVPMTHAEAITARSKFSDPNAIALVEVDTHASQSAPELDSVSGSWMCTKDGKTVEMYEQKNADTLARLGWTVEIASDYLARINREAHASQSAQTKPGEATAAHLRKLANGMAEEIEHASRPLSQNWTPKRGREHASRVFHGEQLARSQKALQVLADHHEAGTVPPCLRGITTKSKILPLVRNHSACNHSTDSIYDNGEPANHTPEAIALRALMASPADAKAENDRKAARELQHAIDALRGVKIEGFFPTPEATAFRMVEQLDLAPGMSVLEPSAGIGSLCEAVKQAEPTAKIEAIEIRPSLVDILARKGFEVHCEDFLECNGDNGKVMNPYDRIIMNPPFERGQDAAHTMHAFQFLKPGGRLVSLVSEGPFFRSDAASVKFREWLEIVGAEVEELPDAFAGPDAFRNTGVRVRMVTVDAVAATPNVAKATDTREPVGSVAQADICPGCEGVTRHYDGAMGYEAYVCESCNEHWSETNKEDHEKHLAEYRASREPVASETVADCCKEIADAVNEAFDNATTREPVGSEEPDWADLNDWAFDNHPQVFEATRYIQPTIRTDLFRKLWIEAGRPDLHASPSAPNLPGETLTTNCTEEPEWSELAKDPEAGTWYHQELERRLSKPLTLLDRYNAAKRPGAVLLMRMGDFYEAFGEHAEACNKVLGLTLTRRGESPMAGFPYHQLWTYVDKLLKTTDVDIMDHDGAIEIHHKDDHDLTPVGWYDQLHASQSAQTSHAS